GRRGGGWGRQRLATESVELVLQARATTDADEAELKAAPRLDAHPVGSDNPSGRLQQPPGAIDIGSFPQRLTRRKPDQRTGIDAPRRQAGAGHAVSDPRRAAAHAGP